MKCSLDSKLQIGYICSIRNRSKNLENWLNLVLRHATATDALITLREHWANVLEAIDGLKQNNLTIDQFISIAKTLLQIIIDSIRAEQDDSLSKTIRDSARFSADIIKTAQVRILVY